MYDLRCNHMVIQAHAREVEARCLGATRRVGCCRPSPFRSRSQLHQVRKKVNQQPFIYLMGTADQGTALAALSMHYTTGVV